MLELATNSTGNTGELLATAHVRENCGVRYESLARELWANLENVVKLSDGQLASISETPPRPLFTKRN